MKKVLIVDDEEILVELYSIIIKKYTNCMIEAAYDGQEAVEKYLGFDEKPDLILMDHRMPVKEGIQAAKEILGFNGDAKILFVSADEKIEKEALAIGGVGFLKKPVMAEVLGETVKKQLHSATPSAYAKGKVHIKGITVPVMHWN